MNARLVVMAALALFLSVFASGQLQEPAKVSATPIYLADPIAFKQELTRRISLQEAAVQGMESSHSANTELAKAYEKLGMLYEDCAQWDRSETALERAVALFRSSPVQTEELAAAITQLGSLHLLVKKLKESEKETREALKIRESLGNRLQIARSWNDLAAVFLAQSKFEKVRDYAQRALDEFKEDVSAGPFDTVSARFAIARALCTTKECPSAIPLLKTALEEAKTAPQANNLPTGLGYFLLGYAYWRSGEMSLAGENMARGTTLMNTMLGWGHPVYLDALRCYAQFLRESHNVEAANVVERQVHQAEAVVDVHSLQAAHEAFGFK
jgi:tetratricopeptide (TPR) repeat protein